MTPIAWDDAPSFPNRLDVQVHAVKENSSSFLRLLGAHQGVWVHTIQVGRSKRPKPHLVEKCPHCSARNEAVWKPYVPAMLYYARPKPRWEYVVLELTCGAFEMVTKHLEPRLFRGNVIEVSRGKTNAKLHARWCEEWNRDLGVLPPPFDVRPVLERLWGVSQVRPSSEPAPINVPVELAPIPELQPAPLPEVHEPMRLNFKAMMEAHKAKNGGGK